jgi:predicted XRE-type DNA-binding protein
MRAKRNRHNKKDIKIFMLQRNLTNRQIAGHVGVSDSAISKFISGELKSKKISSFFQMIGCPFEKGVMVNA